MTYDTITINKALVPYTFSILLAGEMFDFRVDYNNSCGFFTVRLSKDGEVICSGERIVYGKPLFDEIFVQGKFPSVQIVPFDMSKENTAVTFDNLSETVHLIIDNQEKSILTI